MDERNEMDKTDEVMLPGFRFHPTDEELVGFYLKRKIQQKPLSIELIKQLDIYKYDPWDLPSMATTGEKEWYFYCPRDRKYRNSARPNRVTGAGFWKATGTDRPIYSSEGTKCIGLKKSLVFYRGRAAKGVKTDWMMHEFRLPSLTDTSLPKRPFEKNIPPNDSWAICRIFKKTNSVAQRGLSHSWVSPILPEVTESEVYSVARRGKQFGSENMSCSIDEGSELQFSCANGLQQQQQQQQQLGTAVSFPTLDVNNLINCKPCTLPISSTEMLTSFMFPLEDIPLQPKNSVDIATMLLNLPPAILGEVEKVSPIIDFGQPQQCGAFGVEFPLEMNGNFVNLDEDTSLKKTLKVSSIDTNQMESARTASFPFNLPPDLSDEWRPSSLWDSPPCLREMSANLSTNKYCN